MRETSLDEFVGGDGTDERTRDMDPEEATDEHTGDRSSATDESDEESGRDRDASSTGAGAERDGTDEGTTADGRDGDGREDDGRDGDGPDDDGRDGDGREEADATTDGDRVVTPAVSTFAWTPDGVPCARCGETVQGRFRDDDDLVCSPCKTW